MLTAFVVAGAGVVVATGVWRALLGELSGYLLVLVVVVVVFGLVVPDSVLARIAPEPPSPKARRLAFKDLLGEFQKEARTNLNASDQAAVEDWATRTRDLIRAAVGEGEAETFLSHNGVVSYASDTTPEFAHYVQARMRRIASLVGRIDTLTLREDFDPDEWKQHHGT